MLDSIKVRNQALSEIKASKINNASKAFAANDPNVVVLEDEDLVIWAHFKEGTKKYFHEIDWDYLYGLKDHEWCGRRMSDDVMILMFKYVEDRDFVLYEITI